MARLPQPGGDSGNWGDILNAYLLEAHENSGQLKENTVSSTQLADNSVTSAAIATGAVTKNDIGLANVNNTSDDEKPISVVQQEALDTKVDINAIEDAVAATVGTSGVLDTKLAESFVSYSQAPPPDPNVTPVHIDTTTTPPTIKGWNGTEWITLASGGSSNNFEVGGIVAGNFIGSDTVTYPEHEVGDVIIMFAYRNDSGSIDEPIGWATLVSTSATRHHVFYKPIDGAAAIKVSDTWATTDGSYAGWICQVYKGAQTATIIDSGYATVPAADLTPYKAAAYFSGGYNSGAPNIDGLVLAAMDTAGNADVAAHRIPIGTESRPATTPQFAASSVLVGVS